MKDEVKITVIATGFKESGLRRTRQSEQYDPVILSRDRHISHPASRDRQYFRYKQ